MTQPAAEVAASPPWPLLPPVALVPWPLALQHQGRGFGEHQKPVTSPQGQSLLLHPALAQTGGAGDGHSLSS